MFTCSYPSHCCVGSFPSLSPKPVLGVNNLSGEMYISPLTMDISIWYQPKRTFSKKSKLLSFWGKNLQWNYSLQIKFFFHKSLIPWLSLPLSDAFSEKVWSLTVPELVVLRRPLPADAKLIPLVKDALGFRNGGANGSLNAWAAQKNSSRESIPWHPMISTCHNYTYSSPSRISCDRNQNRLRGLNIC